MILAPSGNAGDAQAARQRQQLDVVLNWFEELSIRVPTR
jgi:hypothetical protein